MEKPREDKIGRVLNNVGAKDEAVLVAKWFATEEGQEFLESHMDKEYAEQNKEVFLEKEKLFSRDLWDKKRKNHFSFAFRLVAVLVPFFILMLSFWLLNANIDLLGNADMKVITTQKKESRHLVFQDGTEVFLLPETTLTFPEKFGIRRRNVSLNGEAFFRVAKNPCRPFIVNMKKTSIEVLGTSFLVKSYDGDSNINILLEEGSIDFKIGEDKHHILEAGQELEYSKVTDKIAVIERKSDENYNKWKFNSIVFNNSELRVVLKTLYRWYDKRFVIEDKEVEKYSYTTTFHKTSLSDVLKELEEVSPIKFSYRSDTIFVSKRK